MKDMGADVIFAVDVGSVSDSTPQRYGDSLSGTFQFFHALTSRCMEFSKSLQSILKDTRSTHSVRYSITARICDFRLCSREGQNIPGSTLYAATCTTIWDIRF